MSAWGATFWSPFRSLASRISFCNCPFSRGRLSAPRSLAVSDAVRAIAAQIFAGARLLGVRGRTKGRWRGWADTTDLATQLGNQLWIRA